MSLPAVVVAVLAGLALLWAGGEALVRGSVSLARLLRVSTAVIGLTIVAIGTSMPELAVSLFAAVGGQSDIAVANIVGSNIFNVAVILGVAALLVPLAVHMNAVRLEWPFMFVASLVCLLLARDGSIDRLEGGFFLVSVVAFLAYMVWLSRREISPEDTTELEAAIQPMLAPSRGRQLAGGSAFVVAGVVLLIAGAKLLVAGSVGLAELAGLSQRVIGLTIVAAGTSLPELATSVVAARRRQPDIALANVIGSNIFNILGILGVVSLVRPQAVNPHIVASDNWWMVGIALLLFPMMLTGRRITRLEGGILLAVYGVYLALLF